MKHQLSLIHTRVYPILFAAAILFAMVPRASGQTATLSSTSHNFGSVAVSATSGTYRVTLSNTSTTTALSVTSITAVGPFAQTNTCGTSVAAGRNCAITISFKPIAVGAVTGSVVIDDNATPATQTITLSGTGTVPITLNTASHGFGSLAEGTTSAAYTFTVRNAGTAAIQSLSISTAAPFADTTTCGTALAGGGSCTISTTFAPTAAGAQTGSLSVSFSGIGSPVTATLTGTGVTPVTITPASRSFGSVPQGSTSAASTFTLRNYTTAAMPLTISSSNPEFAATGCASLAASTTCSLSVTFTPTATVTGLQTGTISVAYSGAGSPLSVSVQGTATVPVTISPQSVTFPAVRNVGTASAAHSVTISNSASSAVPLGAIVATPAAFAITGNTCSSSLAARKSCAVTIVFTPTVVGTTTGTLTVPYGTSAAQIVIPLTGSAQVNNLKSVVVSVPNPTLAAGTSEQLTATGTYGSGATGNVTLAATWSTSNQNIASVSSTGMVTGVASGSAIITAAVAQTSSPTVTGTATVVVNGKTITSVTVSAPLASIYPLATDQFTATANYSDGTTGSVAATFASSSVGIATINSSTGLATGVLTTSGGTTNITATVAASPSPITSSAFVLTVPGVQSVSVAPSTPTFPLGLADSTLPYGATNNKVQFAATANYTDGTNAVVTSLATWQAAPAGVASINAAGLATVSGPGSTTVSATFGSVGSTLLTVQAPILETVAVCLGQYPSSSCGTSTVSVGATLGLNATQQFSAEGTYSDGSSQNLTSTATWTAHDPQEVNITAAGLATVLATDNGAHAITAGYGTFGAYQNSDTAWITASTTAPISCPTPTIDMKLLVVNNAAANGGAGYADFPAIQQILNFVGTPYDVVDVNGGAPTLSDGSCHGYYQGVIYAFGDDIYANSTLYQAINTYEQTFKVRQVNWYLNPTPDFGFNNYTGSIPSTGTDTGSYTTEAGPVFFYANTKTPVSFSGAFIYLTTPTTPTTNGGGTVTPLLVDPQGSTLSAITQYTNGVEYLSQMFDSNQYLMHDLVTAYGLVNWVTKGVFLGDYHVYASPQVDDFFIDDSEWIPSTTCLSNPLTLDRTAPDASNLPVFRLSSSDMTQLVAWQKTKQSDPLLSQFELTLAMNGVGTTGNGDWTGLTAPIISSSASGGVATFTAQYFAGLPGETITVTNTKNGGGVLNGTWTIVSATPAAGTSNPVTAGTTKFTVNTPTFTGTLTSASENGVADDTTTATVSATDDLVANMQNYQTNFHWISHTYDHPGTLNGLHQSDPGGDTDSPQVDDIDLEILTNRWVASDPNAQASWMLDTDPSDIVKQLTFNDFNSGNIVTPGVTGLNDPNVPGYLYNDGIRYAVSDTSVVNTTNPPNNNGANPSPNVGIANSFATGIYEVPRHPNDVFYNTANWADDQAEFVCIYSYYVAPNAPAGTVPAPDPPFNTFNAAQVLDFTSSQFVTNMLMGDMDPQMFHQPDLHFSDNYPALTATPFGVPNPPVTIPGLASPHVSSLISDTYDLTFSKYEALYNLPVLSPTLDQAGVLMQNRNSFNLSGVTASIVAAGTSDAEITITMPSQPTAKVPAAVIPVTGLTTNGGVVGNGYELYGGQNISHINMTAGQTITFPLQ